MKVITSERMQHRWSRAELGRQARVHPARVGQIESGRVVPYDRELARIAAALEWESDPRVLLTEAVGGVRSGIS